MIRDLKADGNVLTDQQIQAVSHALPKCWDAMNLNMTHNESISTFSH